MSRPDDPKTYVPSEIDDTEDRMGSVHELDFSERNDERQGRAETNGRHRKLRKSFPADGLPKAA